MKNRLGIAIGLLLAVVGIGLLGYYQPWRPAPPKTETVLLNIPFPAIDFAPFYVAKSKGWLKESLAASGAEPEYLPPFQSIPVTYESLATNRVDLVMSSEVPPIINRASGKDVRILWLSCTLKSEVIVPKASSVDSIRGLKGKKIGTMIGSDSHYWLIRNLENNGLKRDDVSFVNLIPPDAKAAFNTGAIDAWGTFPPFSTIELVNDTAKTIPAIDAPIQVVLVGRGAFYSEHRALADAVIKSLDRAKKWIIENPVEARSIVAEETNLPLKVVEAAWPQLVWTASLDDAMATQMQTNADFLKSEGFIRNALNVRKDLLAEIVK